jgi:hypothetical protein
LSSRRSELRAVALGCAVLAVLAACGTPGGAVRSRGPSTRGVFAAAPSSRAIGPAGPLQAQLVSNAEGFVGKRTIEVGRRTFPPDCTGLVLAIYYSAGLDLERVYPRYRGSGVVRLHSALEDEKLLHRSPRPDAADLVFWDNTYDENEDGRWNDPLTHVGMVMEVSREGTVVYIHYNYRRGVVLEQMNLARPSILGEKGPAGAWIPLNSPMRMAGTSRPGEPTLAGELFRDFGRAWRLAL